MQAPDEEAVEADQLAGARALDVGLGLGFARRLVGRSVAGDQREALGACGEPVAAQDAPDPVGEGPKPYLALELGRQAARAQAWVGDREREDALLDDAREGIWHLRAPALARPEHLQARGVDLTLPAVVGRAVDAERPAGARNVGARGEIEELQAIAEQHVILSHAAPLFVWRL